MLPDKIFGSAGTRVAQLNRHYRHHAARSVLQHALCDGRTGRTALVSSFGTESVVLLHMVSLERPDLPVLFVDTEMLFPETLEYQQATAERPGLSNIQTVRASKTAIAAADPDDRLHEQDADACYAVRKTAPLQAAFAPYDSWITGRKRFQGGQHATLGIFEAEDEVRIKINPLAHWRPQDVRDKNRKEAA